MSVNSPNMCECATRFYPSCTVDKQQLPKEKA